MDGNSGNSKSTRGKTSPGQLALQGGHNEDDHDDDDDGYYDDDDDDNYDDDWRLLLVNLLGKVIMNHKLFLPRRHEFVCVV